MKTGMCLQCIFLFSLPTASTIEYPDSPITIPPLILEEPEKVIAFREDESIELRCVASGQPYPTYYWERNNKFFDLSGLDGRISLVTGVGTLIFARPLEKDSAIYQCFATNKVGTAQTVKVELRVAILEPFPPASVEVHSPRFGYPHTLKCVPPRSFPKADIFWATVVSNEHFNPIDLTDRVTMDPEGDLHFVHILHEDYRDGRTYACIVMNTIMRSIQRGAYAKIYPQGQQVERMPPSIMWQSPPRQRSLRGHTLHMKCIFSGSPTPRVNWDRLDGRMPLRARQESFGQELVIEDVQFEDMGRYECWGNNDEAQTPIRRSFDLSVEAEPYWIQTPQYVAAAENDKVEFHCEAYGLPTPVNLWYLDGVPIAKAEHNPRREVESNRIIFNSVTKEDAQVIQCNATNKHGYIFANAYLNVLDEPPVILDPPSEEYKATEGSVIVLTCKVFGSPRPRIFWRKGFEQLTGGRYKVLEEGHLEITDLAFLDIGVYTCYAENKYGDVSASCVLIVRERTHIIKVPQDLTIPEGSAARFNCKATTDPAETQNLKIKWKKIQRYPHWERDRLFIPNKYTQMVFQNASDNSLEIINTIPLDTGKYVCVASNGLDEVEAEMQLIVQGVPDPPTHVRLQCGTRSSDAWISWSPGKDNNAPILSYILQYNTTFTPDTWTDISSNIPHNQAYYTLDLSPFANYTFRILARNEIGMSSPTQHTREVCKEEVEQRPTTNPQNVIGEGDEPGNLVIFWTPMPEIEQNGKGFYYIVTWKSHEDGGPEGSHRIDITTTWHYVVPENSDIGIYQPFNVSVRAGNAVGESEVEPTVVIGYSGASEPEVRPENITVLEESIQATTAVLTWKHVSTDPKDIRGHFSGYRIQFARESEWPDKMREQDWLMGDPVYYPPPRQRIKKEVSVEGGSDINVAVRRLPANSVVRLQVRVLNKYYVGPASDSIVFRTPQGEPEPPADLSIIIRGSTHFWLRWNAPRESNGDITGYRISYQKVTGIDMGHLQEHLSTPDATQTSANVTGLQPGTLYRVHLSAVNKAGKGQAIFLDRKTRPSGVH